MLTNGSTDFHQIVTKRCHAVLFVTGGTHMKIGPPAFLGTQKVHSLEQKFRLCSFCMVAVWKSKTTGITTISRLPSKLSSGAFEL